MQADPASAIDRIVKRRTKRNTAMKEDNLERSKKPYSVQTPRRTRSLIPRRIFEERESHKKTGKNPSEELTDYNSRNQENKINPDIERMNLEILLLNTLTISAWKVQTVINQFMEDKPYISIFCFTEIKVDCLNFNPVVVKVFSKHRKKKREERRRPDDRIYR